MGFKKHNICLGSRKAQEETLSWEKSRRNTTLPHTGNPKASVLFLSERSSRSDSSSPKCIRIEIKLPKLAKGLCLLCTLCFADHVTKINGGSGDENASRFATFWPGLAKKWKFWVFGRESYLRLKAFRFFNSFFAFPFSRFLLCWLQWLTFYWACLQLKKF